LQLFAGNELANLAAHRSEHRQQLVIRQASLRAEELDDAQCFLPRDTADTLRRTR